ncbi:MAG: hypothetical protein JW996_07405 [Candidatus Cloacimonetes bacterium]|nr:hypothetical protein [Candidatus Cloacimonadota bacterium]
MEIEIREYNQEKDKKACHRIWEEVGWLEKGKQDSIMDSFLENCTVWVGLLNDEAEVMVATAPGNLQYLNESLDFSGVMAVTTGRIARKQGLARRVTAHAVAQSALQGAVVSGLGIFEQGFYNLLGYGSGGYEHIIYFDPGDLKITRSCRQPKRLTFDDYEKIHFSRMRRLKRHGAVSFQGAKLTKAEMLWAKNPFGLGYYDESGIELTHHIWISSKEGEHGPYHVCWMSYQNYDQFLELLALLKSFSDQVRMVQMIEPAGIQMQDFLNYPFRYRINSERGKFENKMIASSWWQMRICNLEKAISATKIPDRKLDFNLIIQDSIGDYLNSESEWRGVNGEYQISIGEESWLKPGKSSALPTLVASVNAFTRLWLGVRPARTLALSEEIRGPEKLLIDLEMLFCLPQPRTDWEF